MATLIAIPDSMSELAEKQARRHGYASVDAYIQDLVRHDCLTPTSRDALDSLESEDDVEMTQEELDQIQNGFSKEERAAIEATLLERVASLDRGEGREMTPEVWEQIRADYQERLRRRNGS